MPADAEPAIGRGKRERGGERGAGGCCGSEGRCRTVGRKVSRTTDGVAWCRQGKMSTKRKLVHILKGIHFEHIDAGGLGRSGGDGIKGTMK